MINTMQSDQNDKLTFINLGTRSQFIAKNKPYLLQSISAVADPSKKSLYLTLHGDVKFYNNYQPDDDLILGHLEIPSTKCMSDNDDDLANKVLSEYYHQCQKLIQLQKSYTDKELCETIKYKQAMFTPFSYVNYISNNLTAIDPQDISTEYLGLAGNYGLQTMLVKINNLPHIKPQLYSQLLHYADSYVYYSHPDNLTKIVQSTDTTVWWHIPRSKENKDYFSLVYFKSLMKTLYQNLFKQKYFEKAVNILNDDDYNYLISLLRLSDYQYKIELPLSVLNVFGDAFDTNLLRTRVTFVMQNAADLDLFCQSLSIAENDKELALTSVLHGYVTPYNDHPPLINSIQIKLNRKSTQIFHYIKLKLRKRGISYIAIYHLINTLKQCLIE